MNTPLLQTKLYIPPPRANLVARPRLIERLNEGLDFGRKLALISAPAGFGKTTLVSDWVAACERPVAWLSLDDGDNDLTRFLGYLVAALQTVAPAIGAGVLAALQSQQQPPLESMLATLLNDITTIEDNAILILDDYHVIESKPINEALTFLLEHLPPQLHLVIATREDPNLPLARLRVRGQLTELRAADLRFTPAEAAAFLSQAMGLNLSEKDAAALESRTEGWIAGLQMAALSMQGRADTAGFIQSFTGSHRFVMDYLLEEVLQQQPQSVQTFLLHTSILDRLCGPLCDAVLGDRTASGQATLAHLEQANLFIVPLDNERHWYRYHHLFADLLRQRLLQQLHQTAASVTGDEMGRVNELHLRASVWYEENGLQAEAFHHALAAKDFERAADLVELAWGAMDRSRQSTTWLDWVKALPDELIRVRPVLSVGYAWALLSSGELEAGEARLRDAERWLDTPSDAREAGMVVVDEAEFQSLPASIASARTYHSLALGDLSATVTYAQRALDLLPEGDHLRRGVPMSLLGLAYWANGDLMTAHRSFVEAMASFRKAGNLLFAITGTHVLADINMARGRLREAVSTYQASLQLAAEQGELVLRGTADVYTRLSELYLEQNDLNAASRHLQRSKELGEQSGLPHWQYRWCLAQARIKEARGDWDSALDLLDEAERVYVRGPVPDVRPIVALKTRVRVRQGRLAEALAWARERDLAVSDALSYLREFEHITLARLLIARYKSEREAHLIDGAMALLARLLQTAEAGGRTGSVIEILVQQALAQEAQGNVSAALVPLARALTIAEPEGYVRIFIDEGAPMCQLLREAAAQGMMPDYTTRLLAAFEAEKPVSERQSYLPPTPSNQPLIEPLSQRELEILELLAQGLSNREIGERLFLALPTIKGHNRNIYGKLQVKRRTEAIARARELGLL